MKKNLLSKVVALSLILSNIHCHQKSSTANISNQARIPASVNSENNTTAKLKAEITNYPSTFLVFLNGATQRLKLKPTLKQYSKVLPDDVYQRLIGLSKKVDDSGFSVERKNSDLILSNPHGSIKVSFNGPQDNIGMMFENKNYDLSQNIIINGLISEIESRIKQEKQKNVLINSNPFYKICLVPTTLFFTKAEAIGTGWFLLGGLALIAIAIAVSANKLGKSLKNTKHEVNVNHGVGKGTEDAINNLAGSIKDLDPEILSNNTLNLTTPQIDTTVLPTSGTSVTDDLGIQ